MKNKYIALFLLCLFHFLILVHSGYAESNHIWVNFLTNPNKQNYEECSKMIERARHDSAIEIEMDDFFTKNNYAYFHAFLKLIRNNDHALTLAFEIAPLVDGGSAEDIRQAAAASINRNPKFYLFLLKNYKDIINPELYLLITESQFDDDKNIVNETINILMQRVCAFEKVHDTDYQDIKKESIKTLNYRIAELRELIGQRGTP